MSLPLVYLALGCNRGDRFVALNRACDLLARHGIEIVRRSSIYVTRPLGSGGAHAASSRRADYYFNAVIEVRTSLRPLELYWRCRDVEREMGRYHREHWEPRLMDVDVILYKGVTIHDRDLTLPHPRWGERDFIIEPLRELGVPQVSFSDSRVVAEPCIATRIRWN